MTSNLIKGAIWGHVVGDALGVPYEFKSRKTIAQQPATDMIGYGTYNLPPGTFSDDSSLSFCLAEGLVGGYDPEIIGQHFISWLFEGFWTPRGTVFDVGNSTRKAILRLHNGILPTEAGGMEESDNGNGSLMRILPLLFYIKSKPVEERFLLTREVSSITHGHLCSVIACFYYLEYANLIMNGSDKWAAFQSLKNSFPAFLENIQISPGEVSRFERILKADIFSFPKEEIFSSGYVIHTLEASLWCLLNSGNYREAVLKAVNMGEDTDTTAAVTGGLAGIYYGYDDIPAEWIGQMARKDDIENLIERFSVAMSES